MTMLPPTATALKEWAIVLEAMREGAQSILLRKGGIRETGGTFEIESKHVWLYPTFEHQHAADIKPAWQARFQELARQRANDHVAIDLYATIETAVPVRRPEVITALEPYHIWTTSFVEQRWTWKPDEPLWVLGLRVYRRATPVQVPIKPSYGGCRSWISLETTLTTDECAPVLTEEQFAGRMAELADALA